MHLFFTVLAALDVPDAEVTFDLPPGVVLAQGQPQQQVQLTANVEQTVELQVQLVATGVQRIEARVAFAYRGGTFGSFGQIFLNVSKTKTEVLPEAPTPPPSTPSTVIEATATP
jgi:hypothetical protein